MFAYVYYLMDKQVAKLPTSFIKKFSMDDYSREKTYRVFWSRYIHSIQNEKDNSNLEALKNLKEPPPKSLWKKDEGERYYSARVLRVEDSLDVLIESISNKRPTLPPTDNQEEFSSTTEDEALQLQKQNKRQEDTEMKKKKEASKHAREAAIFEAAKSSRRDLMKGFQNESDIESESDDDPEIISKSIYTQLKMSFDLLEKEKEKIDKKLEIAETKLSECQKENEELKTICNEVLELRLLNRQLQEKLLALPTQGIQAVESNQTESDSEKMEVELDAGIVLDKNVYRDICELGDIKKFTKSLAVAIWGSATLSGRSVRWRACRNKNGPKKIIPGTEKTSVQNDSKPPLTPEKLSVISAQMRKYLERKGKSIPEIDNSIKQRNRYISDKIQDIRSSLARAEARNKCLQ